MTGINNNKVIKYIKSDVYRYYGKCSTPFVLKKYLSNPLVRFHVALRMRQSIDII